MTVPSADTNWSELEDINGATTPAVLLDEYLEYVGGAVRARMAHEHTWTTGQGNADSEGRHIPGSVGAVDINDTATITAASSEPTGAICYDTDKQALQIGNGTNYFPMAGAHAFHVKRASDADQALVADAFADIQFDDEDFDYGDNFDKTTYKWTAPVTGVVIMVCQIKYITIKDGDRMGVALVENDGATDTLIRRQRFRVGGQGSQSIFAAWIVPVTANYTYRIQGFRDEVASGDEVEGTSKDTFWGGAYLFGTVSA